MEINIKSIKDLFEGKPICCDEEMFEYGSCFDGKTNEIFVCLNCGTFFQLTEGKLDASEIKFYKEIKNTS